MTTLDDDDMAEAIAEMLERGRRLEAVAEHQEGVNRYLADRLADLTGGEPRTTYDPDLTAAASPGSSGGADGGFTRRRLMAYTAASLVAGGIAGRAIAGPAVRHPATDRLSRPEPIPGESVVLASYAAASPASTGPMITVPAPTGIAATDMANILSALAQATPGTSVYLQWGSSATYAIDQEIPIPAGVRLTATGAQDEVTSAGPPSNPGGAMATLHQVPGQSLLCTAASAAYLAGLYGPSNPGKYAQFNALYNNGSPNTVGDTGIEIDHIAFDGRNGETAAGNTHGHGLVIFSAGSRIHDNFFFNTPEVGVVVADRNHAGQPGTGLLTDNRIVDNQFLNTGKQCVAVWSTAGSAGCESGYLLNNNLQAPSKEFASQTTGPNTNASGQPWEAVRMENSAGWWVANNHPYQVPGNGWYLANAWGLHFINNSTDDFGAFPTNGLTYVGYDFYLSAPLASQSTPLQPLFINGNQLSGYEGLNSNNHEAGLGNLAANQTNAFLYYRVTMQAAGQSNPSPMSFVEHADNSAHQNSQPASPISGASVSSGSSTVKFGASVATLLQAGMSVTDSAGFIPDNTFIGSVSTDGMSITLADGQGNAVKASGSSSGDTLSFPGPSSAGWTYVNSVKSSTLVVHRTNELISPTVPADPVTTGPGDVTIIDPANMAGGVTVSGSPSSGETIVATSATTAMWGVPPVGVPSGAAGGVLAGNYPNPRLNPNLVTAFTASGTYVVPATATQLRVTCIGAGGGGGGGGAAASSITQSGGSGGAAGTVSEQLVGVNSGQQLVVTVGAGGHGGAGGAKGGSNAGATGASGGDSTLSGTGVLVRGSGGGGGKGGPAGSTTIEPGAAYGAASGTFTAATGGGSGGRSGHHGGNPVAGSPGGGGGGGAATGGSGGAAGSPGSATSGGAAGADGAGSGAGGSAGKPATDQGSGGGGGGGGTSGAAGGTGGAGAPGYVIVEVIC